MNKNLTVGELKELIKDLDDSLDVIIQYNIDDETVNVEQVSDVSLISLESSAAIASNNLCLSSCNIEESYKKLISKMLDKENLVVVKPLR